ncbi:permease prefix domain 2-containing transporter [Larkinella soli]|uniref:permease prefix domain 2-containing transporter n=1 Tax=Larkinella soli TaxID=1770527 RepID=UPI000FFC581C|nr:permease prefix domain 2-containing transporter [Larkinella soli]
MKPQPPRFADRLLRWFCAPHLLEEIQGDLHEEFAYQLGRVGLSAARRRYWRDVLGFVRPFSLRRPSKEETTTLMNPIMIRNYIKIAIRNLTKNRAYSVINIAGLAAGMGVALLIGLWVWDEISYSTNHEHYDRIAQVRQNQTFNGSVQTWTSMPYPMGQVLRSSYGSDFRRVVMSSWNEDHILSVNDRRLNKRGQFMESEAPEMLSLKMLRGSRDGLKDPRSILLSESTARSLFGDADPMGKLIRMDSRFALKVTGVYEDLPDNSAFSDVTYLAPWDLVFVFNDWLKKMEDPWGMNGFQVFVELADHVGLEQASARIRLAKRQHVEKDDLRFNPELFLHPMSRWYLYSEFENGVNTGGRIEFVWLFGIIGVFVLLLACINFMNLSTARSEKRGREVGIRKAVGSVRGQLIGQFFSESLLVVFIAFLLALLLVQLSLPAFNEVADKKMSIPWTSPWFWLLGLGFGLLTSLIAGSYPALYLSSFQPVKVLKGTFRVGRFASLPRKALVVVQFTVSVTLIIGTIIVYRQIQYAKNRPVGYDRDGLVMVRMTTKELHKHFDVVREELKKTGAVTEMAESEGPPTSVWSTNGSFSWKGKDPGLAVDFPNTGVSHDYGKTVGWEFKLGRDFSREFATDTAAFVVNEAAVKFMGLKKPVGEIIDWDGHPFRIIGVIRDMVVESPYEPVRPSLYCLAKPHDNFAIMRINPTVGTREALAKIGTVFKRYSPEAPFDYQFVDQEYGNKFGYEERIGRLTTFFAVLAIFISCLGLFGLASFVAEQRTREIGVRKVLGASLLNVWSLLSRDFVLLVAIAFVIAMPTAWYFLGTWLQKYTYRTEISWWIFAAAGFGAMALTLLTVSFQAIRAGMMNPVKSLRSE